MENIVVSLLIFSFYICALSVKGLLVARDCHHIICNWWMGSIISSGRPIKEVGWKGVVQPDRIELALLLSCIFPAQVPGEVQYRSVKIFWAIYLIANKKPKLRIYAHQHQHWWNQYNSGQLMQRANATTRRNNYHMIEHTHIYRRPYKGLSTYYVSRRRGGRG